MSDSLAKQRYEKARLAFINKDFETVKKLALQSRIELENEGYVRAGPIFRWIEKEWLEKALRMGAIVGTETGYHPKAEVIEVDEITGYRGRTPTIEKKTKLDISKFKAFCREYEEYKSKKKEDQE